MEVSVVEFMDMLLAHLDKADGPRGCRTITDWREFSEEIREDIAAFYRDYHITIEQDRLDALKCAEETYP